MLKIDKLVVSYGVAPVLREINMEVPQGKIVTLLGANGAGKSTTLKAVSGLLKPLSGDILFCKESISGVSPEKIVKMGVSHVPEGRQVFPGLTVEENLKMGAYINYKPKMVAEKMAMVFDLFPRLKERIKQLAGTMSGGEQQMLAIGRGLMNDPKLLMLDEPSLGLAPIIIDGIFDKIKEINSLGTTILLIEQNANLALSVSDYAYMLSVGKIAMEGDTGEIRDNKNLLEVYLGGDH
ncbi:MAG: ABC transporter ATP-binding protein [Bacillota bacterium]|nr:ABC transporter ATP-binding protein [Bacillota bacterium]MDD3850841.1 ABC transporter ATP-binding protein [Bacillota bacterium]MDD4707529.1 ABC transporter ATP-binding protein [Bacillota bacterium]